MEQMYGEAIDQMQADEPVAVMTENDDTILMGGIDARVPIASEARAAEVDTGWNAGFDAAMSHTRQFALQQAIQYVLARPGSDYGSAFVVHTAKAFEDYLAGK